MQKPGLSLYFAFYLIFLISCSPTTNYQTKKDISYNSSTIMNGKEAELQQFPEVIGIVSDDSI